SLYRLAHHIDFQQTAHSLSFFGNSRLRGGRSSIGTGHFFQTSSRFAVRLMRWRTSVSSSASKMASNWSPGLAGARVVGTLNRRLESRVTIMVGLSHQSPALST